MTGPVKDKESRWWFWLWLVLGGCALTLVGAGLFWRYSTSVEDVKAPSYVKLKVETATVDGRSISATLELAAGPETRGAVEQRKQVITNELSSYLGGLDAKVLTDVDRRDALLRSIRKKINAQLPENAQVEKVLMSNFLVGT